jgi:hypothetical protein
MKTWDDLTGEQKTFVTRYLKKSAKDLFRKREKTETNKAIIGAFGKYLDLRALFDTRAATVPADYPQRVPVMALAAAAEAQNEEGKFDQAAATIASAIPQIAQLHTDLTEAADTLRASAAPAGEDGFAQADKDRVAAARQKILDQLTDPLPTFAQMTTARAAVPAYEMAVFRATEAMADVAAAASALEQAKARASAMLTATADLDATPYATTPQADELAATIAAAKQLQAEIGLVPVDDATDMRALAAKLIEFTDANAVVVLVAKAVQSLVNDVTVQYANVRASLASGRNADLTRFKNEAEHGQMTALRGELAADIAHIETHLASRDPDDLLALKTRIAESAARAEQLDTLQRTVGIRMTKADLAAKGAKAAHQDGIVKLMETNPDAADKVVASLERNAALLGGQPATPEFIRTKKGQVDTLKSEEAAVLKEWQDADAQLSEKTSELTTLREAYDLLNAEIQALEEPVDEAKLDALNEAIAAHNDKLAELQTAEQLKEVKAEEWRAKLAEREQAEKVLAAAQTQRTMLDAISFGPLSPVAGRPIPNDMVADVVELFDRNPALATQTCALASTAKDPKSVAETAIFLAGKCENGFEWQPPAGDNGVVPPPKSWNEKYSAEYAKNLLSRAAYFGPEFSAEAQDAIARGVHREQNALLRAAGSVNDKQTAAIRATEAAGAMMKQVTNDQGKTVVEIDLDSDAFKHVLERQKFSGDGQFKPSAMMNAEMDKLKEFFGDPAVGAIRHAEAEAILNSVDKVPASPAARKLLEDSVGIPPADFDDPDKKDEVIQKIQTAILKSMVTPVAQADVGSCFATAPLRKLRDEDPIAVMEMYTDIATTGIFNPMQGRALPAVTNLPPGDDPLTRSLEFSVAAASARLANSRERKAVNSEMFNGPGTLGDLQSELSKKEWRRLEPELMAAVLGGYTFTYDPTASASGVSSDGSSNKGFMRMVDIDTQQPILTKTEFTAFVKRKALEAATAAGLKDKAKAKIEAFIADQKFVDAVAKAAGKNPPWDMAFGGYGDEAGDALMGKGGGKRSTDLVSENPTDTTGERAIKVLKSLGGLSDQGMTMVATSGMHSFNALPPEGEYKKLLTGDVDANIKSMLVDPGQKIATTKLPKDRAVYLFDKQMEAAVNRVKTDAEKDLIRAEFGARPTADMTPAELEAHIASKLDAAKAAVADRKAAEWAAKQDAPPDAAALSAKKSELKTGQDELFKNIATRTMAEELGVPEFVVADPNWGSEGDHNLFVIAPDPLTGEPRMWQKSVMGGGLWPLGDDWLKANWRVED